MFYPSPQTRLYFHDNNGHPLSGGSVSTYLSASSLPIQTAKDFKGKVKNPTTVPLDERGEAVVFLSPGVVYRFVVKDSLGATVLDQDGISLPISGSDSGVPYEFKSADGSVLISATTEDGLVSYDFSIAPLVSRVEELSSEVSSRYESLHHDIQTEQTNRNLVETALWDEVHNLRSNEILCVNTDDTTFTYGTLANRKAVLLVGSNGCSIGYLGSLSTSAANFYAFMPKQRGTYKANENVMYTFDFSTKEWSTTFGPADWSFFIFNYSSALTFNDLMSKLGPGGTCVLQISSYNFAWMQNIDFTGKGATWVRKTANAMEYYYLSTAGVWSMESVADIDSAIIPSDASSTNQLATKAYADAIGERLEARYLGYNEQGYPFPTHAALTSATAYYYQGAAVSPDTNDITTVTADEDHIGMTGEASTTRYRWNGTGWAFEYVINNTGLSESQLMAVNSGITPAKVSAYDGLQANIDTKQDRLTFDTAPAANSTNPVTSGGVKTALDKKQDKLTAGQGISLSGTTISNTYGVTRTRVDQITDDLLIYISPFYPKSEPRVYDMAWSFCLQFSEVFKISFSGLVLKTDTAIDVFVSGMGGEAIDSSITRVSQMSQKLRVAFVTDTAGKVALAVYLTGEDLGVRATYFYGWLGEPVAGTICKTPTPFNKSDYGTFKDITINLKTMYDSCASNAKVDAKQDKLTFDTTPTADSTNPVTSGGVKTALDEKQDKLTNTDAEIKTAVSNAHAHSNKTVLDGITSTKVTAWDENLAAALNSDLISSGSEPSYGVYVGGNANTGSWSKCYCSFLLSTTMDPDMTAHTYIGTFTFRHGVVLNYELKCLTGTPTNPMRIAVVYTTKSDSTYNYGLYLIPSAPASSTHAVHRLTCICRTNFDWACRALTAAECAAVDNDNAKQALMPVRLFFAGGGSNVTTTGGSWLPTFNSGTISKCRGIVDLSVHVDLSVINQTTYIGTLSSYDITLVNSSGTDILPSSYHQTGRMPRPPKGSVAAGGTVDISHTHRFVFPITASNNLLAGWRPKITLPSNYTLDSSAQVNISATCSGIVLPYYYSDTSF